MERDATAQKEISDLKKAANLALEKVKISTKESLKQAEGESASQLKLAREQLDSVTASWRRDQSENVELKQLIDHLKVSGKSELKNHLLAAEEAAAKMRETFELRLAESLKRQKTQLDDEIKSREMGEQKGKFKEEKACVEGLENMKEVLEGGEEREGSAGGGGNGKGGKADSEGGKADSEGGKADSEVDSEVGKADSKDWDHPDMAATHIVIAQTPSSSVPKIDSSAAAAASKTVAAVSGVSMVQRTKRLREEDDNSCEERKRRRNLKR